MGVARTDAYYSLAPFIGAVLAVLLLAEPVTLRLLLSAALMGLGCIFISPSGKAMSMSMSPWSMSIFMSTMNTTSINTMDQ